MTKSVVSINFQPPEILSSCCILYCIPFLLKTPHRILVNSPAHVSVCSFASSAHSSPCPVLPFSTNLAWSSLRRASQRENASLCARRQVFGLPVSPARQRVASCCEFRSLSLQKCVNFSSSGLFLVVEEEKLSTQVLSDLHALLPHSYL